MGTILKVPNPFSSLFLHYTHNLCQLYFAPDFFNILSRISLMFFFYIPDQEYQGKNEMRGGVPKKHARTRDQYARSSKSIA